MLKSTAFLFAFFFLFSCLTVFSQSNNAHAELVIKQADSLMKTDKDKAISITKSLLTKAKEDSKIQLRALAILERAYYSKKEYDSAFYYANKGIEKALQLQDTVEIIHFYAKRGYFYFNRFKNSEALEDFYKGKMYYEALNNQKSKDKKLNLQYSRLLNNIASVYIRYVQLDSSIVYLSKAIDVMEANQASKRLIAIGKYNLAEVYVKLNDYKKSKALQEESLESGIEAKDSLIITSCFLNIGNACLKSNDTLGALDKYKNSLVYSIPSKDYRLQAIAYRKIGSLYLHQQKNKLSKQYFFKALSLFDKSQVAKDSKTTVYLELGDWYKLNKKYDSAVYFNKKAADTAKFYKLIEREAEAYLDISNIYKNNQKYALALDYLQQHLVLQDSILNRDKKKTIESLKTVFEIEQKKKEIVSLKKLNESENQKAAAVQSRQQVIIISIISVLTLLLISFLSFISKRKKEKKLTEIKLRNEELKNKEYQTDIEHKTKELTTHALNMMQKNQLLTDVRNRIKQISVNADSKSKQELKTIIREINLSQKTDNDWDLFKKYFENVNHNFYTNLKKINSNLSTNDCRLAALVSLNLNIKETASLLSISPNSVKVARHRLRKKLQIDTKEDLYQYLTSL